MNPAEQLVSIITRVYERGLTTTSGGNISTIDQNGDIWITPSAIDKGSLKPDDIMCIRKDGAIEGKHKPSSEHPFHRAIYKNRPDIRAIIHAHSPALVSFSMVHQTPDTNAFLHSRQLCGKIGYAIYETPGSQLLGERIADEFAKGFNTVIMENHGLVLGGINLDNVYQVFETFEYSARAIINAKTIGTPTYLTDKQIEKALSFTKPPLPTYNDGSFSKSEQEMSEEITKIIHRAYTHELMEASFGAISVRLNDNDFLITPGAVSRFNIKSNDIVRIKSGKCENGKEPDESFNLHKVIYENHPEINSIIITQPPYLSAFSLTTEPFDVRTIPESWIFLQDVIKIPFDSPDPLEICRLLSPSTNTLIIENGPIIVTGSKLLATFDKLEVAELSAKALVMSKSIGNLYPINEQQIEDLRRVFLK